MKSPKESWIFALGNSCSGRVAVLLCRGKRELLLRRRERGWQQPNPICEIGFDAIFKSSLKWRFSSQIQCRRIFSCYRRRRNKFERQKRRQFCYITMFENHFKKSLIVHGEGSQTKDARLFAPKINFLHCWVILTQKSKWDIFADFKLLSTKRQKILSCHYQSDGREIGTAF